MSFWIALKHVAAHYALDASRSALCHTLHSCMQGLGSEDAPIHVGDLLDGSCSWPGDELRNPSSTAHLIS
jgi:hypothetical protein